MLALTVVAGNDSMTIVSSHDDGTVRFLAAAGPTAQRGVVRSRPAHDDDGSEGLIQALAAGMVGDRPLVFSGGDDHRIRVWDVGRKAQAQPPHRDWVRAIVAARLVVDEDAPNPELAVVSGGDDDVIQVRDMQGQRPGYAKSGHHRGVHALAFAPGNPPVIVSGGADHRVRAWLPEEVRLLAKHGATVRALNADTLSGKRLVVSASGDGDVQVWDLSTMSLFERLRTAGGLRAVALGELAGADRTAYPVVVSGGGGTAVRVSRLTGELVGEFRGHAAPVRSLTVTRLGQRPVVLSGDEHGVVLAWDLGTCEALGTVARGLGEVNAITARQRGAGNGCTWVAVGAGESVVMASWTARHGWEQRMAVGVGCEVLGVALPGEEEDDEPAGQVAVAAARGVVMLQVE